MYCHDSAITAPTDQDFLVKLRGSTYRGLACRRWGLSTAFH